MALNNTRGLYVPSTNVWDPSQAQNLEDVTPALRELLVRLYQNINLLSLAVNKKGSAVYYPSQFIDGSTWFPNPNGTAAQKSTNRPGWRMVVDFGALANTALKSVAHGIVCNTSTSFTHIYATASKPTAAFSYIPVPADWITVDGTNVNITTPADYSAYTICYVVLEYLQN